MRSFDFFEPTTIEEASSLLAQNKDEATVLAGGTDLLIGLKDHIETPKSVISLERIPGLDGIAYDENTGLLIGGMTKMRSIEQSSIIRNRYTALAEGASEVGSIQIRNLATLGGNICNASPAADTVAALLVFGAQVEIAGTDGKRTVPIRDFFLGPGESTLKRDEIVTGFICPPRPAYSGSHYIKQKIREVMDLAFIGVAASLQLTSGVVEDIKIGLAAVAPTPIRATDAEDILIAGTDGKRTIPIQDFFLGPGESTLKRGEIVTGITCRPRPASSGSYYIKQKIREVMDLAFIGVAASLQLTSGVVEDIKIGLAAVAPTPIRATDAEDILKGNPLTEAILDEAASAASAQSSPISDLRCSADYREEMVRVLTKRTIQTSAARI